MKWINEKTVQGDPMDTKNYFIPKEEYNIPLVNEGIQEGRKLVFCKDCKYMKVHGWNPKKEVSTCHFHCEFWNHAVDDCDFCSRGEKKDE